MKKIILLSLCTFLFTEYGQSEILSLNNKETLLKQDPKNKNQTISKNKQKNKKTEKKEMLDKKISISDENQPINKSKTKKTK